MKPFARFIVLAASVLSCLALPCASGAQIIQGITLEKLGLLYSPGTGARPIAMGGAYTAVSDDAFALLYNPAGLADIRRKEISIGIHQQHDEITNTYLSLSSTQSSSHTSLGHLAAVYPYPTYRGSLVFAFGVFQAGSSNLESIKNAYLADIPATVENNFIQSGTIYQYHVGFGFDLSPRAAVGASFVLWDESVNFNEEINTAGTDSSVFFKDDVSMDLDGVSFNVGLLLRASDNIRAGLSITSPAWLSFEGDGTTISEYEYANDPGVRWTTDPEVSLIEEDYTLPMKFSGGVALRLSAVTLAADVAYIDYSQTEYNGIAITSEVDPGKKHVLKENWNFHAGAEVTLPQAPIRFRGGFSYVPFELSTVEEIAYIDNGVISVVADFEAEREREFFTFGVGGLINRVLTLDLAVAIGGYEKVTSDTQHATVLTEKRSITEVIVSGAYRF